HEPCVPYSRAVDGSVRVVGRLALAAVAWHARCTRWYGIMCDLVLLYSYVVMNLTCAQLNVLVYGKNHPRPKHISEDETTTIELVPETLQAFTRTLVMQDTTMTPQEAIANAASS
ncbi:unnamed protein product, partial [Ectocarpus sp. 12 AP-2014]